MDRRQFAGLAVGAASLAATAPALAAKKPPTSWDNLVLVKSKKLKYVYLLPGADFRVYNKVIVEPTEVAFRKNWMRDYNSTTVRDLRMQIRDEDVQKAVTEGGKAATEIFIKAYQDAGIQVVSQPGPDVMKLRSAIIDLDVTAPDMRSAARTRSYSDQAGSATLVLEVRDSTTNAILGRAVDSEIAGDNGVAMMRSSVSNRADFERVGKDWAKAAANGLNELKRLSPINDAGATTTVAAAK